MKTLTFNSNSLKKYLFFILVVVLSFSVHSQIAGKQYTATEQLSKETVMAFFEKFGTQDPKAIAALVADNVDWYIFDSSLFPWTGKRSSRKEVETVFATLFSYFNPGKESFDLQSLMVDGHEVAVFAKLGREFKKSGKGFTMLVAIHLEVQNGKISKFYLYEQTPILEAAYMGKDQVIKN